MIVVDTNVVSEVTRLAPDTAVGRWFAEHGDDALHVTSTVVAELLFGVETMPIGGRRTQLEERIDSILGDLFPARVLSFDEDAARAYAMVRASRRRAGRPISFGDAQIAAVCLVHDASLVTRNVRDFVGCGIRLVNPWEG